MKTRAGYFRGSPAAMATLASLAVLLVFVLDAITPQTLSIEIAYEVGVVIAALSGNRTLTIRIVCLALLGDVFGACADSATGGWHWDATALENRIISLTSIFIVGALALSIQRDAEIDARSYVRLSQQRREAALNVAVDRFWSSLQPHLIEQAMTEEACSVFESTGALWSPSGGEVLWTSGGRGKKAIWQNQPARGTEAAEAVAALESLTSITTVSRNPAVAALTSQLTLAPHYLALPIADADTRFGVLIVATQDEIAGEDAITTAKEFSLRARSALQQTQLIEALREGNAALAERHRVIEDLVEAISHDVRTPLVALSVTLAQALEGAFGPLPAEYTAVLSDSRLSIDGIKRLAETLLLVARFEAETPRSRPETVTLYDLTRELVSELSGWAESAGLVLRTEVAVDAAVVGSQADLRRALSNLLSNAIRSTPRGGTIELRVTHQGNSVEIAVRDDGYGVEPAVRQTLFQRFTKGASTVGGTGLGLYIVRRVAEESGGTVRYDACVPRGSIFTIVLPDAAKLAA